MYALPPSLSGALQVFYYALKAVVYPMAPVFDMQVGLQPLHHATHRMTLCRHLLQPQDMMLPIA